MSPEEGPGKQGADHHDRCDQEDEVAALDLARLHGVEAHDLIFLIAAIVVIGALLALAFFG